MESNLKHRTAFLVISYGVLIQLFILPFYEFSILFESQKNPYLILKAFVIASFLVFAYLLYRKKLIRHWIKIFYLSCYSCILIGEYFSPGYHFTVIQFMFVCAIVFEGFPLMATILMILYLIEYTLLPFSKTVYPAYYYYQNAVYYAVLSSWIISVVLERTVNRVKNKQTFLDRKLRYKGIKTDLFLHDLKNKLQPLVSQYPDQNDFKEIIKTIQVFNSFNEEGEVQFSEVALKTKEKFKIQGECYISGTEDFFIDQMDLQTILCNLMTNSQKAALAKNIQLQIFLKNSLKGFSYEDNAGGMSDEQFKFFTQKDMKPYPGHEKHGLGLLLIKKLLEHHQGKFVIKKIVNGTRFEITY